MSDIFLKYVRLFFLKYIWVLDPCLLFGGFGACKGCFPRFLEKFDKLLFPRFSSFSCQTMIFTKIQTIFQIFATLFSYICFQIFVKLFGFLSRHGFESEIIKSENKHLFSGFGLMAEVDSYSCSCVGSYLTT